MKKFYISFAIAFVLVIHLVSLFAMADSYTFSHNNEEGIFVNKNATFEESNLTYTTFSSESGSDFVSGNPGKYSISSRLYYTPIR